MKRLTCVVWLLYSCFCHGSDVMFFNPARVGQSVQMVEPLLLSPSTNAIAPNRIALELNATKVSGAILEYPKGVTKEMLRHSINSKFAAAEKKLDGTKFYGWRDEVSKFTFMAGELDGGCTLTVRSVDKDVLKGTN